MKSGTSTGSVRITLGLPASTNYKFLTYIFDLKSVGDYRAGYETVSFLSNRLYEELFGTNYFQSRYAGSPGATNFISANVNGIYSSINNIPGSTAKATAYYWNQMSGSGYFNKFKYVFDRNNKKQYIFVNNTYLGYSNLSIDPFTITALKLNHNVTGTKNGPYLVLKNISIAGSNNLNVASSYNG